MCMCVVWLLIQMCSRNLLGQSTGYCYQSMFYKSMYTSQSYGSSITPKSIPPPTTPTRVCTPVRVMGAPSHPNPSLPPPLLQEYVHQSELWELHHTQIHPSPHHSYKSMYTSQSYGSSITPKSLPPPTTPTRVCTPVRVMGAPSHPNPSLPPPLLQEYVHQSELWELHHTQIHPSPHHSYKSMYTSQSYGSSITPKSLPPPTTPTRVCTPVRVMGAPSHPNPSLSPHHSYKSMYTSQSYGSSITPKSLPPPTTPTRVCTPVRVMGAPSHPNPSLPPPLLQEYVHQSELWELHHTQIHPSPHHSYKSMYTSQSYGSSITPKSLPPPTTPTRVCTPVRVMGAPSHPNPSFPPPLLQEYVHQSELWELHHTQIPPSPHHSYKSMYTSQSYGSSITPKSLPPPTTPTRVCTPVRVMGAPSHPNPSLPPPLLQEYVHQSELWELHHTQIPPSPHHSYKSMYTSQSYGSSITPKSLPPPTTPTRVCTPVRVMGAPSHPNPSLPPPLPQDRYTDLDNL